MSGRVLFVDDEPRVLAGVQRLMRPHRARWDVRVAVGGEAALELVAKEPFDFVVSDMRMPGMDGAALLARVRDVRPGVARVVLSGQTELEIAIRAVPIAHQFLSKPCCPEALLALLDRGRAALDRLAEPHLRERVVGIGALPCEVSASCALKELMRDEAASIDQAAGIIAGDTAMAAKALQLASSSFFGTHRRARDAREAVTLLGSVLLRELTLKTAVFAGCDASTQGVRETPSATFVERVGRLTSRAAAAGDALPAGELGAALLGLWGVAA